MTLANVYLLFIMFDNLQPKFVQFFVTAAFKPDWLEYLEYSWLNLHTMESN